MLTHDEHIINKNHDARMALGILDQLPASVSRTVFVVDNNNTMVGSLTDGDIRRGLLNGLEISSPVEMFMNTSFKSLQKNMDNVEMIAQFRKDDIKLVPMLDQASRIIEIIDLQKIKTLLPLTALVMAGGRGERLRPYTDTVPKSMLCIGEKPILEHNIDRLISFGITDIYISVKYLKEQIMDYFGDGSAKGVRIKYVEEGTALGTLGALSLIEHINHGDVLVMNSDILTNIDFEDFFRFYRKEGASMALASIPFQVNVPYAVLEVDYNEVSSFIEKPTYTYYSNGGIYILRTKLKELLEHNSFFNATDLMDKVIRLDGEKLVHYPLLGYWLDIGKHQDFLKAQEDIKHLNLL